MRRLSLYLILLCASLFLSGCNEKNSIEEIYSRSAEWPAKLAESGELEINLNMDEQADLISLVNVNVEGAQLISKFEVLISGCKNNFIIENYDASLEKLELFDFDGDGIEELIIMFDTHGGGGQGTHDIYVLWLKDSCIEAHKLDTLVELTIDVDPTYNFDGVYSFEKVLYNGREKLLVRQYMWGEEGHADAKGEMVSIVTLSKDKTRFVAEESWIQK